MHRVQKHRKPMEDSELTTDKSVQRENDSFAAKQPPHPTGYLSSSVRPVCFPHCSLRAQETAGKHGLTATFGNRNDICTRLNKIAAYSRENDSNTEEWEQIRRIISLHLTIYIAIPPQTLETVKNKTVRWLQLRLLRYPVRALLPPSWASTGGMLPVNMCGPAA